MALTIEQLMALVESFNAVTNARADKLTLTLGYQTEQGESVTISHAYSLEGIYPERDVIDNGPETKQCTSCSRLFQSIEGRTLCWECDTEGEDIEYGE